MIGQQAKPFQALFIKQNLFIYLIINLFGSKHINETYNKNKETVYPKK